MVYLTFLFVNKRICYKAVWHGLSVTAEFLRCFFVCNFYISVAWHYGSVPRCHPGFIDTVADSTRLTGVTEKNGFQLKCQKQS